MTVGDTKDLAVFNAVINEPGSQFAHSAKNLFFRLLIRCQHPCFMQPKPHNQLLLEIPHDVTTFAIETDVALPPELRGVPLTLSLVHLPAIATLHAGDHEAVHLDPEPMEVYRVGTQRFRIDAESTKAERLTLRRSRTVRTQSFVDGFVRSSRAEMGTAAS